MCGICGFVSKKRITLDDLNRMNDTMFHRGPDDSGTEIFPLSNGYTLGMAQRRLAILDLSSLGHQPMHSKNKRISVVFNGEIYNFNVLKKELSEYEFVSNCDTEVIIAAYMKWGQACFQKLQGMFAIALFDRENDELFLVRDRIGKKPLYYWYEDKNLVFASELKPIMQTPGFKKAIRSDVLGRYLYQQYINAPDSIFQNVYKLEPGQVLSLKNGEVSIFAYWDIMEIYQRKKMLQKPLYEEAKSELKGKLKQAVQQRMITDVPLGTFLSGGYDSTLVTAIAQEISKEPIKTFSIGFNDKKYDEAEYAAQVAQYLGTNHTELYIDENEMLSLVDSIPRYFDEPFADSSQIPSMLVSKLAREKVTVALSGDGGDEFFCGYNLYEQIALAQRLDFFGGMIHGICNLPGIRKFDIENTLPLKVKAVVKNRATETKTQVGSEQYCKCARELVLGEQIPLKYCEESFLIEKNWQKRRMLLDMETYLPGDILCKVDRASMKYSLETRCPILDTEVMEYSWCLPHEYKYKNGVKKRILKDIVYDYLPKEMMERPKKGFSVPLDQWLRGPLKEELLELSNKDFLCKENLFNVDAVQQLVDAYLKNGDKGSGSGENYSRIIWAYFMFQKWYNEYIIVG